jgi:hypothetical protein
LTIAVISLGLRLWNWASVPDSVRLRLLGVRIALRPGAAFATDAGTDSCQDVSKVAICTVTVISEL